MYEYIFMPARQPFASSNYGCQHHISMHKNSNFGVLVKKKKKHRGIDVWDKGSNTVVKAWLSAEAAIIEAFFL